MSYNWNKDCQHIFIDSGMKTTWCSKCHIKGEYNFMTNEFTMHHEDGKQNTISIDAHRMIQDDRIKREEESQRWQEDPISINIDIDEEEII